MRDVAVVALAVVASDEVASDEVDLVVAVKSKLEQARK